MWYKPYNTSLISGSIHASGQQHAIPVQKGAYLQNKLTNSTRLFSLFSRILRLLCTLYVFHNLLLTSVLIDICVVPSKTAHFLIQYFHRCQTQK